MNIFISPENIPANAIAGAYQYNLVFLSYLIAVIASYVSLVIVTRGRAATGADKVRNSVLGATVMGVGVWSMHFTGMIAYQLPMEHYYNPYLTALSLLIAIGFSFAVFHNITREKLSLKRVIISAPLMGIGVAGMHYTGMAAMDMKGRILYIPSLFTLSVCIAIAASAAAIWIMWRLRTVTKHQIILKFIAALILGFAVCGMHYTGMAAAVFVPFADCRTDIVQDRTFILLCVIVATFFIVALGLFLFDYEKIASGRLNIWGSTLFISILCSSIILYVSISSEESYEYAKADYKNQAHSEALQVVHNLENSFTQIYQGLRTIAQLHSVKTIDRHANNLSDNDRISIQEIYNNLNNNVELSEVYILLAGFNPEIVDPDTGKPEEPVVRFESNIKGKVLEGHETEEAEVEEVEIYEYMEMREHLEWFEKYYPDRSSISGMEFPSLSSGEIVTCDNTRFSPKAPNDQDRSGIVYSVPFYDVDGKFKGIVTGVKLTHSFRKSLLKPYYAIVNVAHEYTVFPELDGQAKISERFVKEGSPDPSLIYSEAIPLAVNDNSGKWLLWVGQPDYLFSGSVKVEDIRNQKLFGYASALGLGFIWLSFFILMRRSFAAEAKKMGKAKEEAVKADKAKSDFLANMTHELRTPLNSIIGITNILSERALDIEDRNMFEIVLQSSNMLLAQVNDILDISKIEAGEVKLEELGFDIKDVIEKLLASSRMMAERKLLDFECNFEKDMPFVKGDSHRLSQIVSNLISNAIKYTDKGGVTAYFFVVPDRSAKVVLHGRVSDTGIGIPRDKLGNIFSKFSQVDVSNTRRFGGTGLGLAIVKELVSLMGGEIGVESEVGKGSSFWFKIPFVKADEIDVITKTSVMEQANKTKGVLDPADAKVLIAEDHPFNQEYMKLLLARYGFNNVDLKENGREVLTALDSAEYDLILMDCFMPELNGYETSKAIRLRERATGKYVPIVAMTANVMVGEREKCLEAGMDEYIPKPVVESNFVDVLSRWIKFPEKPDYIAQSARNSSKESPPVDLAMLRTFTNGNPDLERRLLALFVRKTEENISALAASCCDGESQEWVDAAHSLKGGAAGVGAEALKDLCKVAQSMQTAHAIERSAILSKINEKYAEIKRYLVDSKSLIDQT